MIITNTRAFCGFLKSLKEICIFFTVCHHRVNNHYIFDTYVVGCYIWYYSGNFGGNERVLSYKSIPLYVGMI